MQEGTQLGFLLLSSIQCFTVSSIPEDIGVNSVMAVSLQGEKKQPTGFLGIIYTIVKMDSASEI